LWLFYPPISNRVPALPELGSLWWGLKLSSPPRLNTSRKPRKSTSKNASWGGNIFLVKKVALNQENKRGKDAKIMGIADDYSFPIAIEQKAFRHLK